MVWKPKEKELTLEEALSLAKKELAPFWIGSAPLLAGVKSKQKQTLYPLNPQFNESAWGLYFLDPTDFSGINTLLFAREMHQRYSGHGLKMLGIVQPAYSFLRESKPLEIFLDRYQVHFPVAIDSDWLLSNCLSIRRLPLLVLLNQGQIAFEKTGENWFEDTEEDMQEFLRSKDPGLALFPVYQPESTWIQDSARWEFGRGKGMTFPVPGFGKPEKGFATGHFPDNENKQLGENNFWITGIWLQDAERIVTSDPQAKIGFQCPTAHLALVLERLAKSNEPAKVVIESGGIPVLDVFGGVDLQYDDEGQSVLRIDQPRLYDVLNKLPLKNRDITLRFPTADRHPVALYGVRFCE